MTCWSALSASETRPHPGTFPEEEGTMEGLSIMVRQAHHERTEGERTMELPRGFEQGDPI